MHGSGTTGPGGRRLTATTLATAVLALVAIQLVAGLRVADRDRAGVARGAAAMARDEQGHPVYQVQGVPEPFIRFVNERVPPGASVEYVVNGVSSCAPTGRVFGRMLWLQFHAAPRPTVCGADWRVYLNTPLPPDTPAADRYGKDLGAVPLRVTP